MFNDKKQIIYTVTGNIGAGKTYNTIQWIKHRIEQNGGPLPITIATPTNGLSYQFERDLSAAGIECIVINSEIHRSAGEEYKRQCDLNYKGIMIVNYNVAIDYASYASNRILIVDEVFTPYYRFIIEFDNANDVKSIDVSPVEDQEEYYELSFTVQTVRILKELQERANAFRNYSKTTKDVMSYVANDQYQVIVEKSSYDKLIDPEQYIVRGKDGEKVAERKRSLNIGVFMKPSILRHYSEVLIISANFYETLLARMWGKDVEFIRNMWIESRLDNEYLYSKAPLIKLHHIPIPNLSKSFISRLGNGDEEEGTQELANMVADGLRNIIGDKPHIYTMNKHKRKNKKYDWNLANGQLVIVNPHGWNDLNSFNNAVFFAALNYDPQSVARLKAFFGISRATANTALAHHTFYQFIGRTSLRDRNSTEDIILVAPDEGAANYLQSLLGCSASEALPIQFDEQPKRGRKATLAHMTPEERRAYKTAQRREQRAREKAEAACGAHA